MWRKGFSILAVGLLVVATAVALFWARGYWVIDTIGLWPRPTRSTSATFAFSSEPGRIGLSVFTYQFPPLKRSEFITTRRQQHELVEGLKWKTERLAAMSPMVTAAYRNGFQIASTQLQPYPIEWDRGSLANNWRLSGVNSRWRMFAAPDWVVLVLTVLPSVMILARLKAHRSLARLVPPGTAAAT